MQITMMVGKIHRATVTDADLNYQGSISLDPALIRAADFLLNQQVDILNINNGERFTTYVIEGKAGEVCLNGAAARKVCKGDKVIIVAYGQMPREQAENFTPNVVHVDACNQILATQETL